MKKTITDYIKSLGGSAHYSGNTKTMWITDPIKDVAQSIEECILIKFGFDLPFKLATN
jgi:hypothetical protein